MSEESTKAKPCRVCKAEKGAIHPYYSHQVKTEDFKTKTVHEFMCSACKKDINKRIKEAVQEVKPVALRENMLFQLKIA